MKQDLEESSADIIFQHEEEKTQANSKIGI